MVNTPTPVRCSQKKILTQTVIFGYRPSLGQTPNGGTTAKMKASLGGPAPFPAREHERHDLFWSSRSFFRGWHWKLVENMGIFMGMEPYQIWKCNGIFKKMKAQTKLWFNWFNQNWDSTIMIWTFGKLLFADVTGNTWSLPINFGV
jgi:hypothetical protein